VLGARDVLVAEEQHAVAQQQGADLGDQAVVLRRGAEVQVRQFGADRAGQRLDAIEVVSELTMAGLARLMGSPPAPASGSCRVDED
jgi:hypothetical protein